jgi:outer membrane protein assembly factor BamB
VVDFGGATVVNDLVFTSTLDGMVYALNRADGSEAWSWQAPAGINATPAVAGDTIVVPAGGGRRRRAAALRGLARWLAPSGRSGRAGCGPSGAPRRGRW